MKLHALDQYGEATLELAKEFMHKRQFEKAEVLLDDVLALDPLNSTAADLKLKIQNADTETRPSRLNS